jgi:hypothetical protein
MKRHKRLHKRGFNIIAKVLLKLRTQLAIRKCNKVWHSLRKQGVLNNRDMIFYILTPSFSVKRPVIKAVLTKGYNDDGSIKPLRQLKDVKGFTENLNSGEIPVTEFDLFDRTVYLYNVKEKGDFIEGRLVRYPVLSKSSRALIFSRELVRIKTKDINERVHYDSFDGVLASEL